MLPTPSHLDPHVATWLLSDADGNVRAAVICWGVVLGAFIILRIPREVLLGCLIAAGATGGLAATVVDIAAQPATASAREEVVPPRAPSAPAPSEPAAGHVTRARPY